MSISVAFIYSTGLADADIMKAWIRDKLGREGSIQRQLVGTRNFTSRSRFRELYFKGNITISHGRHEIMAEVESDNLFLYENVNYKITDPAQYDPAHLSHLVLEGSARSRASCLYPGLGSFGQLDRERRPALESLPTHAQSAGIATSSRGLAVFSRRT